MTDDEAKGILILFVIGMILICIGTLFLWGLKGLVVFLIFVGIAMVTVAIVAAS